jgi:hypothetical protein
VAQAWQQAWVFAPQRGLRIRIIISKFGFQQNNFTPNSLFA